MATELGDDNAGRRMQDNDETAEGQPDGLLVLRKNDGNEQIEM